MLKTKILYLLAHVSLLVVWLAYVRNFQYTRKFTMTKCLGVRQQALTFILFFPYFRLETLKTRIMSSKLISSSSPPTPPTSSRSDSLILTTARQMYRSGGIRAFWPGLVSFGNILE
jgi:hypothetical protein